MTSLRVWPHPLSAVGPLPQPQHPPQLCTWVETGPLILAHCEPFPPNLARPQHKGSAVEKPVLTLHANLSSQEASVLTLALFRELITVVINYVNISV